MVAHRRRRRSGAGATAACISSVSGSNRRSRRWTFPRPGDALRTRRGSHRARPRLGEAARCAARAAAQAPGEWFGPSRRAQRRRQRRDSRDPSGLGCLRWLRTNPPYPSPEPTADVDLRLLRRAVELSQREDARRRGRAVRGGRRAGRRDRRRRVEPRHLGERPDRARGGHGDPRRVRAARPLRALRPDDLLELRAVPDVPGCDLLGAPRPARSTPTPATTPPRSASTMPSSTPSSRGRSTSRSCRSSGSSSPKRVPCSSSGARRTTRSATEARRRSFPRAPIPQAAPPRAESPRRSPAASGRGSGGGRRPAAPPAQERAFFTAHQTARPSMSGGSPTALVLRRICSAPSSPGVDAEIGRKIGRKSVMFGILYVVGEWRAGSRPRRRRPAPRPSPSRCPG